MANTFGTFLDTLHRLESAEREKEVLQLQRDSERQRLEREIKQIAADAAAAKAAVQDRMSAKWDRYLTQAEAWPQSEVFSIAKMLLAASGATMPVKTVMAKSGLSQESFFGALLAGRDKGIFQISDEGPEPVVNLTKLGSTLVG
jgi:hypothetical protein